MTDPAPSKTQVRETLQHVLASETFSRSERARKLLRYLVEEQLDGRADRLKGFSIAVDVFGKDSAHDSSTDAIVRVQAGRLREMLDQYFSAEGLHHKVRINVPRGNYVPAYSLSDASSTPKPSGSAVSPIAAPRKRAHADSPLSRFVVRQVRLFWVAFGVVFAMLFFVSWNSWRDSGIDMSMTASATPANRMAEAAVSLPHVFLRMTEDEASSRVGAVMRSALTGFDTIRYIALQAPEIGNAGAQDFVFDLAPGPVDGSVQITFQNIRSGEVLTSRVISAEELEPNDIGDAVADIITSTLPTSGALYSYLEAKSLQRGLTRCLLLNNGYYLDQSEAKHKAAYQCFEKLMEMGAYSPLISSELAALQLEAVTDKYAYPPNASMDAALQSARRAVQMAPTSPYAHRAYGFLYTRMGVTGEALKWLKKSYELGRYDLTMAAAYGYGLIMAGHYAEGVPIMEQAVEKTSARASWWDYTLFLGAYAQGNLDLAASASDALNATRRPHYIAARLLSADHRGITKVVEDLRGILLDKHKNFSADPGAYYERADYPPDMIEKLVEGLRKAGLALQS